MRVKDTLITRGLSAGLCILALVLQVIIAGKTGKAEEKNQDGLTVYDADSRVLSETNEERNFRSKNCLRRDIGNGIILRIQFMLVEQ